MNYVYLLMSCYAQSGLMCVEHVFACPDAAEKKLHDLRASPASDYNEFLVTKRQVEA